MEAYLVFLKTWGDPSIFLLNQWHAGVRVNYLERQVILTFSGFKNLEKFAGVKVDW